MTAYMPGDECSCTCCYGRTRIHVVRVPDAAAVETNYVVRSVPMPEAEAEAEAPRRPAWQNLQARNVRRWHRRGGKR